MASSLSPTSCHSTRRQRLERAGSVQKSDLDPRFEFVLKMMIICHDWYSNLVFLKQHLKPFIYYSDNSPTKEKSCSLCIVVNVPFPFLVPLVKCKYIWVGTVVCLQMIFDDYSGSIIIHIIRGARVVCHSQSEAYLLLLWPIRGRGVCYDCVICIMPGPEAATGPRHRQPGSA